MLHYDPRINLASDTQAPTQQLPDLSSKASNRKLVR